VLIAQFEASWSNCTTVSVRDVPLLTTAPGVNVIALIPQKNSHLLPATAVSGAATARVVNLMERSHHSSHLISSHLTSFRLYWMCAATALSESLRSARPSSPWLRPITAHSVPMKRGEMRWDEWYEPSLTKTPASSAPSEIFLGDGMNFYGVRNTEDVAYLSETAALIRLARVYQFSSELSVRTWN